MKRILPFFLIFMFLIAPVSAEEKKSTDLGGTAKSTILIEQSSGKVLFEKDADIRLPIASVTKTMTMLLAMEAWDSGVIAPDTKLTCSEYAASMGGSQVFLEPGEQMSFDEILKAIVVSSGNDASVMLAEHLAGTEGEFVRLMNEKAASLGMKNTHFINCNGLDEGTEGFSSARDVALMSAELMKHDKITKYTTIWMDSLRGGEFGLSNTNRLIHYYEGANGIKTGSTSEAFYCLSAGAKRDGMQLIAVVLAAPTTVERFATATSMLDYGFANYAVLDIGNGEKFGSVKLEKGDILEMSVVPSVGGAVSGAPPKVVVPKAKKNQVKEEVILPKKISAPIKKGDKVGIVKYKIGDEVINEVDLVAICDSERMNVWDSFTKNLKQVF
ncbi:MAG: D-alanyl-D-alanine carboxypeptidase [Oscillospiraceae bacterium]|nr:D-alanyl-D-alanine carboxypeptidase [Oscillospiraceae bacterium]